VYGVTQTSVCIAQWQPRSPHSTVILFRYVEVVTFVKYQVLYVDVQGATK